VHQGQRVRGLGNPDQSYSRNMLGQHAPDWRRGLRLNCRTHLAVRRRTLPIWPGSGVLSSGVTRKSARLVALASFQTPAAAAVPLRRPWKATTRSNTK
jgi:hypothetical protein